MQPYQIIAPTAPAVPMVVSVPHCGTAFPDELAGHFRPELANPPDDTDFWVHQLYQFAPAMGITLVHARYSRWVIDLNRAPDNQNLYNDGRIITALTPTTDFLGNSIYTSPDLEPDAAEVARRKAAYFTPYYSALGEQLQALQAQFGQVLLWDAHSIRRQVPTIHPEPFPDLILGDNDEQSAAPALIQATVETLGGGPYSFRHNYPFKGGNITRSFGQPQTGVHALQLEMCKTLYLDDSETHYAADRASQVQLLLQETFRRLLKILMG